MVAESLSPLEQTLPSQLCFGQEAARVAAGQMKAAAEQQVMNFNIVHGRKKSFKGLDAVAINNAPVSLPITANVRGPSVLRTH